MARGGYYDPASGPLTPSERVVLAAWRAFRPTLRALGAALPALAVLAAQSAAAAPVSIFGDGGTAVPRGDLDAPYTAERAGLGADPGLELGFGLRLPLGGRAALGASFHFLDFGNYEGKDAQDRTLRVEAFSYRYACEAETILPGPPTRVRPFAALGAGLYRNRLQVLLPDSGQKESRSVNTLGLSLRLGLRWRGFELSWLTHRNRFDTLQFSEPASQRSWNWDQTGFRLGWHLLPDQD